MFGDSRLDESYPLLARLADPLAAPGRQVVGRQAETVALLAAMARPEVCNALLLGPAGCGKTTLVHAAADADPDRLYLEVDPARMIADAGGPERMPSLLKGFFSEAEQFTITQGRQLVVFIDEFHQLAQLSPAALEAIKPVLAASGARSIRVIGASTFDEYHEYIQPNQALAERLQRITLAAPDEATTIRILQDMAAVYDVTGHVTDPSVYELIYQYTQRHLPAAAQPRKSVLVLDAMVGWHRLTGRLLDRTLLAQVIGQVAGVDVAFQADAARIKQQLDRVVLAQDAATSIVARRLQLCTADLHDPARPLASFLLAGSSGVGKTELAKRLASLLFGDGRRLIRFDMTEYATDDSVGLFRAELARRVWDTAHAVLLFDEIEKASPLVTRIMLQILDDGRLSDSLQRTVSFLGCYIVLTSNAAAEIFSTIAQYEPDDTGSGGGLIAYEKLIRTSLAQAQGGNRFPPELLGRIDAIVPFQPLSRATLERIVTRKLARMARDVLVKHGVHVEVSAQVVRYLVEDRGETDSDAGGARAAVARLTDEVTTEVATHLNQRPDARHLNVQVAGRLASDDKSLLRGDARISVAVGSAPRRGAAPAGSSRLVTTTSRITAGIGRGTSSDQTPLWKE